MTYHVRKGLEERKGFITHLHLCGLKALCRWLYGGVEDVVGKEGVRDRFQIIDVNDDDPNAAFVIGAGGYTNLSVIYDGLSGDRDKHLSGVVDNER